MSQVTKDSVAILLSEIFDEEYRDLPLKAKGDYISSLLSGLSVLKHLDEDQKIEFDKFYETLSSEQQKKVKDFLHKELQVIAKQIYTKALNNLKENPQNAEVFFILLQFAVDVGGDSDIVKDRIFDYYNIFKEVVNKVMSKEKLERMLVDLLKENGEVYVRYVIEKPSLDVYINLLEIFLEKQGLTFEDIQCLEELFEFITLRRSVNLIKQDIKFLRYVIERQSYWAVDIILNDIKKALKEINLTWEDIGISESEVQRWEDFSKL